MIALSEYAARACHSAAGLIFWIDVNGKSETKTHRARFVGYVHPPFGDRL
jgi:hypothetical protein